MAAFWCVLLGLPLVCFSASLIGTSSNMLMRRESPPVEHFTISPSGPTLLRRDTSKVKVHKAERKISKYLQGCEHTFLGGSVNSIMGPCTLPTGLDFVPLNVTLLQDAIYTESPKTSPFLWLRYGDSDVASITDLNAGSIEGADFNSQCIRDGAKQMFLGEGMPDKANIIQAVGAFFLCEENHEGLHTSIEMFMANHPTRSFPYVNTFYLPLDWSRVPKARPVVLVGPKHLDALHCMLGHVAFVEVPLPTHGCGAIKGLVDQMIDISGTKYPDHSVLFLVAGSLVGKIAAYTAFQTLHNKDIIVDVGSSLDGWAGRASRDYNEDITRFCKEKKQWVAYDACQTHCKDIFTDVQCKQCDAGTRL